MNFKTDNHEKHYILWSEIVKRLQYFKDTGGLYVTEGTIDTLKKDICKSHPSLDEFSYCYACDEMYRIQFEKKSSADGCIYCPIDWGYDIKVKTRDCLSPESIYSRLLQERCIDYVIDLATKIRDAKWKETSTAND